MLDYGFVSVTCICIVHHSYHFSAWLWILHEEGWWAIRGPSVCHEDTDSSTISNKAFTACKSILHLFLIHSFHNIFKIKVIIETAHNSSYSDYWYVWSWCHLISVIIMLKTVISNPTSFQFWLKQMNNWKFNIFSLGFFSISVTFCRTFIMRDLHEYMYLSLKKNQIKEVEIRN